MNPKQVHEKRRKRTSLKKADQYRAEAAFFKQRNLALAKDLRGEQEAKEEIARNKELLGKSKEELRQDHVQLIDHLNWIRSRKLVRFALWLQTLYGEFESPEARRKAIDSTWAEKTNERNDIVNAMNEINSGKAREMLDKEYEALTKEIQLLEKLI